MRPNSRVLDPVALALGLDDPAAVGEPVRGGPGEAFRSKHLGPGSWKWHRFGYSLQANAKVTEGAPARRS